LSSCGRLQGNTWHFCLLRAETCNNSLLCSIVCAFFSEEFTTPSPPFWSRRLDTCLKIGLGLEGGRLGGLLGCGICLGGKRGELQEPPGPYPGRVEDKEDATHQGARGDPMALGGWIESWRGGEMGLSASGKEKGV
jgi:hypothetical protein